MVTCEAGKYSRTSVLLLAQQDCEQHHCSGRRSWCTDTGNVNTSTRSNVQPWLPKQQQFQFSPDQVGECGFRGDWLASWPRTKRLLYVNDSTEQAGTVDHTHRNRYLGHWCMFYSLYQVHSFSDPEKLCMIRENNPDFTMNLWFRIDTSSLLNRENIYGSSCENWCFDVAVFSQGTLESGFF